MAAYRSRLLILEDDPAVGRVIHRVATASGHDARVVTQPEQFFKALEEWHPTHIALDLVMPDMDGIQILAELGVRRCTADIIITSGMGARVLDAAGRGAREHGLNIVGLLAKPFSPAALRALLLEPPRSTRQLEPGSAEDPAAMGSQFTEAEFRKALEQREFEVHYQPKIDCIQGRLVGFEALARWPSAQGRLIMPDEFIPFAEQHALIDELTSRILDQALAWFGPRFVDDKAAAYIAPLHPGQLDLSLSINLSASSLHDMRLVDHISAACLEHQVPAARVIFELTETSAMENPGAALDMLTRMRVKGFQLSIDDFGMGHSSMRQLVRMPFTEIKVDRSFVISAALSSESRAVVKSIVDLGRSLGLRSVAEGVEDAGTLALLQQLGCDFAQGYWIGRPMAGDAVAGWIAARRPGD
jgi:EAL domain-containing protein (putative c-di-GMP-specific phosphodiesterase class I)/ActR/RegA family two-component response regulator